MNTPRWKRLNSKYVYESQWMKVRHDEVVKPDGSEGTYDIIEKDHFVLVIPQIGELFYLVDQYRYPIEERSLEFPQGSREPDEPPETGAKRELLEETGLIPGSLKEIGFLYLANGHETQGFYVYLARDCTISQRKLEGSEQDMFTKTFTFAQLKAAVSRNEIKDSPTVAAFGLLMSQI